MRGGDGWVATCGVQDVGDAVNATADGHIVPAEVFVGDVDFGGGVWVLVDPVGGERDGEREVAGLG